MKFLSLLNELYYWQVGAALRPAFASDMPSDVTAMACEVWSLHLIKISYVLSPCYNTDITSSSHWEGSAAVKGVFEYK